MESYINLIKQTQGSIDYTKMPTSFIQMHEESMAMIERMAEHIVTISLSSILLACMNIIGVWLMWRLRKVGFLFYTTGQILLILTPIIFMGINWISIMSAIANGIFSLAFIIMYGLQLKRMS